MNYEDWELIEENIKEKVYKHKQSGVVVGHRADGSISAPPGIKIELVNKYPEMFIEKGAVDACKALWDLNISTAECSAYDDICTIVIKKLSPENDEIFKTLSKENPNHYKVLEADWKFGACYLIASKGGNISPDLITPFEMQDIQEFVLDSEEFLMDYFECFEYEIKEEGVFRIFDKSKQEKSIEEYAKEKGAIYVKEEDKVYLSQFYYDRHLKYLDYVKQKNETLGV